MVFSGVEWYAMVWYGVVSCMVWCGFVWSGAVRCDAVL